MTNTTSLPPWEDIERDYVDTGLPHKLVVRAAPAIYVFTDAGAARMGARFSLENSPAGAETANLEQIVVADVIIDGERLLEISTAIKPLFESFYRLAAQVAEAVLDGETPPTALSQSIALWELLLEQSKVLSEERQAGLFGELLVLERLVDAGVEDPFAAWVGPDRQAHDFRWGDYELEVKTTAGGRRVHTINGVDQLSPSPDCRLFLLSLQITDAGAGGHTLPQLVDRLRALAVGTDRDLFDRRLSAAGYVERHRARYARRRRLRTPPALIEIVDGTPRIVPEALASLPSRFAPQRIVKLVYDIDVTTMGDLDGSPRFHAIVPPSLGGSIL